MRRIPVNNSGFALNTNILLSDFVPIINSLDTYFAFFELPKISNILNLDDIAPNFIESKYW